MKKIGVALGSGAARGFAHIGILRALQAEGIPIDCVAGTSMGAIVGAVYAAGALPEMEKILEHFTWKEMRALLDPLFPTSGLLGGKHIEKLLGRLLNSQRIEAFSTPFAAVAADVATGKEVVLTSGDAVTAVRASMAIPGIFTPVFLDGRFLVDGGIVTPVPVQAARNLGAEIVIAVNLAGDMGKRSYIKPPAEHSPSRNSGKPDEPNLPPFLKGAIEKGRSLLEEHTQSVEEWFEERVERGREVLQDKAPFFGDWLKKGDESVEFPDIFRVLFNSINIMQDYLTKAGFVQFPPDVLLTPDLADMRLVDFHKPQEGIREGERVVREALPQIRAALDGTADSSAAEK